MCTFAVVDKGCSFSCSTRFFPVLRLTEGKENAR